MTNDQWLKERRKGIGGSDIGTIIGVNCDRNGNPYKTLVDLWLEKTGRSSPTIENKFMTAGKLLEPVIVEMFKQATAYNILPESNTNELYHHPDYPFALGTPDRIYEIDGKKGILECKNTRMLITFDNLPKSWFCQIQWYMGLTGIKESNIAWLVQGCDFFYHKFDFVPDFFDYLLNKAKEFWKYIEIDKPPPPITGNDVEQLFPKSLSGQSIKASEETIKLYHELLNAKSKIGIYKKKELHIIDILKLIMKDSEYLTDENENILISWQSKENHRNRRFSIKKNT